MADEMLARPSASQSVRRIKTGSAERASEFNAAAHGLRGLASIMVLGAHILGGTARHIYQTNETYVQAIEAPWFLGVFGVKLFFVISGYVILPSALRYSIPEFAKRRFLRIYPLFFVASVIFIILNYATNEYPKTNNIESIVSGLLFVNLFTGTEQLTPNAWSLTYEVMFYALTCWVVYTSVKRPRAIAAALAWATCLVFLVVFPVSIFFLAGALIRIFGTRIAIDTGILRTLEVILFFTAAYSASRGVFEYNLYDFAEPAALSALVSTVAYFSLAVDPRSLTSVLLQNPFSNYMGAISYSLYLVHPYTYYFVRWIFVELKLFTDEVWFSIATFGVVVFVASVALSHIAHVLLERWPYSWYFHQRVYRNGSN
ncbi:acyltransferase [Pararhizobium sp. YC-54]|uniref:acyltransferase family protein n=1 Tax=Pararhizobium sp. YC-54 TaxID=2986920 RepID=UPI0021F7F197|nr:acyltransferase [Pararhizobium sp. YC-54]MCV9999549.1 acyltransferase [Pararhizobium sp. YC-54]